jgi:outer membrane receptor protein involved in Fe transport
VEDLWDIMEDLRLTIGGRYDHYSDFGGHFSPRVGLNWEFAQNYYAKFLYGTEFRAPTFEELYDPQFGNPDFKPQTKDSYELSFGVKFHPSFSAQVTGFYFERKNLIGIGPTDPGTSAITNVGEATGDGVELQMKYDFGRGTYLSMNYTYTNDLNVNYTSVDKHVSYPKPKLWMSPKQLGTFTANIRLNKYLNLNAYLLYRGDWNRSESDLRDDPGDYAIVNATLIARNFLKGLKGLEARAVVKNLFNKEYTSPTDEWQPDDLPMPGINFFLELRYAF